MELIRGLHNLRDRHRGSVVTIGAFDGIHRGHQAVIADLLARAHALGLPSTVIVFEPLPREYFAPVQAPARLMSFREKVTMLAKLGVHRLLCIRFDRTFSLLSAQQFIDTVLVQGLGARYVVVGDDLRFGHDREGCVELLQREGERAGFDVRATSTITAQGERVSSTRLRAVLTAGDLATAERMLGRPYAMLGRVVHGQRIGHRIGVPTANLELRRRRSPLAGVYVVEVRVDGRLLPAVANIGTRPTVGDGLKANLETHLLDFEGDLYGRLIEVIFRQLIREERKFDSFEQLRRSIADDIRVAREYFAKHPQQPDQRNP